MITLRRLIERAKILGHIDLSANRQDLGGSFGDSKENSNRSGYVTKADLDALEKVLDNLFKTANIAVEFTRHFRERINHSRNKDQITVQELRSLFQKTYQKYKEQITSMGPPTEAVLNDVQTNINLPFALVWDKKNGELDLISKTVMRKKNFLTPNRKLKV